MMYVSGIEMGPIRFSLLWLISSEIIPKLITTIIVRLNELKLIENIAQCSGETKQQNKTNTNRSKINMREKKKKKLNDCTVAKG